MRCEPQALLPGEGEHVAKPGGGSTSFVAADSERHRAIVDAIGGDVRQLTHLASRMRGFDWTRDGSALVFAGVLERFLGLYCSINSFVKTIVKTKQREGVFFEWARRAGNQALL